MELEISELGFKAKGLEFEVWGLDGIGVYGVEFSVSGWGLHFTVWSDQKRISPGQVTTSPDLTFRWVVSVEDCPKVAYIQVQRPIETGET